MQNPQSFFQFPAERLGAAEVFPHLSGKNLSVFAWVVHSGGKQGVYCLRRNGQLVLRCTWWGTWGKELVAAGYAVVLTAVVIIRLLRQAQKYQEKLKQRGKTTGRRTGT